DRREDDRARDGFGGEEFSGRNRRRFGRRQAAAAKEGGQAGASGGRAEGGLHGAAAEFVGGLRDPLFGGVERGFDGWRGSVAGGAAGRDPSPPDGFAFGEGVGHEAHGIGEEGLVEQQRDELPGMEIRAGQRHGLVAEFGHGGEGERLRIGVRGGGAHIS